MLCSSVCLIKNILDQYFYRFVAYSYSMNTLYQIDNVPGLLEPWARQ